jgi:hypothetical protein
LSFDESGGKPPHSKIGQAGEIGRAIFVRAGEACLARDGLQSKLGHYRFSHLLFPTSV